MTRYKRMFESLKTRGEGAFIPFLMLGDPNLEQSLKLLHRLVECGADALELGLPFSDPVADGPVIQAAAQRVLNSGVKASQALALLREFRKDNEHTPVGLLLYANLIESQGPAAYYKRLADFGVDSVLVADVPSLEGESYAGLARDCGIAPVFIAAPNTPDSALKRIAGLTEGYTYVVSRKGVTGADKRAGGGHEHLFQKLKDYGAAPPVLGFGISQPEQVRAALKAGAAGAISGSAIVRRIRALVEQSGVEAPAEDEGLAQFLKSMKAATNLA